MKKEGEVVLQVLEKFSMRPVVHHVGADLHTAADGRPHVGAGGCGLKEAAALGEPLQEKTLCQNCGEEPSSRQPLTFGTFF